MPRRVRGTAYRRTQKCEKCGELHTKCTGHNRAGKACPQPAIAPLTVCHFHGGKALRGSDVPSYKTGRFSKYLPDRLAARYHEALSDPGYASLREQMAVSYALESQVLERLAQKGVDVGAAFDALHQLHDAWSAFNAALAAQNEEAAKSWRLSVHERLNQAIAATGQLKAERDLEAQWVRLVEVRRRMADTEHRRELRLGANISAEEAISLIGAVVSVVRVYVTDKPTLARIAAGVDSLLHRNEGNQGEEEPSESGGYVH